MHGTLSLAIGAMLLSAGNTTPLSAAGSNNPAQDAVDRAKQAERRTVSGRTAGPGNGALRPRGND